MSASQPEVWLRGPVPGVPPLLQPIAHGLLQAREEVERLLEDFPDELLWTRPTGVASVGFHLLHLSGSLDRLFSYARGEPLSEAQRETLAAEGRAGEGMGTRQQLVERFHQQVERALEQLRETDERTLTDPRGVGRAQLPSTVLGLLFHAAEHTQRHVGQLLVTARIQRDADRAV